MCAPCSGFNPLGSMLWVQCSGLNPLGSILWVQSYVGSMLLIPAALQPVAEKSYRNASLSYRVFTLSKLWLSELPVMHYTEVPSYFWQPCCVMLC
jgi:hypothetical protein